MEKINSFKDFKKYVEEKEGVWSTSAIYFSQTKDYYVIYYMPNYPDISPDDKTIMYNHTTKKFINIDTHNS